MYELLEQRYFLLPERQCRCLRSIPQWQRLDCCHGLVVNLDRLRLLISHAIDVDRYGDTSRKSSLCGKRVEIINPKNGKVIRILLVSEFFIIMFFRSRLPSPLLMPALLAKIAIPLISLMVPSQRLPQRVKAWFPVGFFSPCGELGTQCTDVQYKVIWKYV